LPLALACGSQAPASASSSGPFDAVVAASDYMSSQIGAVALDGGSGFTGGVDLGIDPALSTSRGRDFFLARDIGVFFELDPMTGQPLPGAMFDANDPGHAGSSDPQDVAVDPAGDLWVVRYDIPSILILGPDGSPDGNPVDISSYDSDGNPQAAFIRIVDAPGAPSDSTSKAYVFLQRLSPELLPNKPSMILRIDVMTRAVEAAIPLLGENVFEVTELDPATGAFFLAESGTFSVADEPHAGIEAFDVASETSKMLVTKHALGASPAEVAVTAGCAVAIVADASSANVTTLVSFDPVTGTELQPLAGPVLPTSAGFFLQGTAWLTGDVLLVGDGDPAQPRASKLHVFDRTGGCTLTERPATLPLPLKAIAILPVP
jgi:hypothetical protein